MHVIHALAGAPGSVRQQWFTIKMAIEQNLPFSAKTLHPIVGVSIQLASAALFRSSIASPIPWLVVLALELANEWTDLTVEIWPNRSDQIAGSIYDLLLTMALPTMLLLTARYCPAVMAKRG